MEISKKTSPLMMSLSGAPLNFLPSAAALYAALACGSSFQVKPLQAAQQQTCQDSASLSI